MDSKIVYLRSLTLESLLKSYQAGELHSISLKDISLIEAVDPVILNARHKDDTKAIVYSVTESCYFPIDYTKLSEGLRCIHCFRKIVDKNFLGIPIGYEYLDNGKKLFHCVDVLCTFNCCLSELLPRTRDYMTSSLYSRSLVLLNLIFSQYHPDKELKPTTYDKRCLKVFNGYMGYKEYHKDSLLINNPREDIIFSQKPLERR